MGTNRQIEDPGPTSDLERTRFREVLAAVLAVLMVPTLALGLLDPVEGGLALLAAIVLGVAVRTLSRVPVPRLAWVSALVAVALGAAAILVAVTTRPAPDASGRVTSPLSGGLLVLVWGYELAALVTLVGGVLYVVRVIRHVRHPD